MAFLSGNRAGSIIGNDIATAGGQYPMTWATTAAAGTKYVWMKASQRHNFIDPNFLSANIAAARAAGIKVGAYHFAEPQTNPGIGGAETEADHFIGTVTGQFGFGNMGDIFPVLDLEAVQSTTGFTSDQMVEWIEAFVNRVTLLTGRQTLLYTAYYVADSYAPERWTHSTRGDILQGICPLWLAAKDPAVYTGVRTAAEPAYPNFNFTEFAGYLGGTSTDWLVWQYSLDLPDVAMGSTYGASSVDIDIDALRVGATVDYLTPPTQVLNVGATPGDTEVLVTWDASLIDDLQDYTLYVNGSVNTTGITTTSKLVTGLTNGVSYFFEVTANDEWEEGPKSAPAAATPESAVSGPIAGKKAKVLAYGSSIPFVDEATTTSDNMCYQITDTIKRVWCRNCTITVKDGGSPTAESFTVDRLTGRVMFATSAARTITVSGEYLPTHTVGEAFEYTFTLSADNADSTVFGEEFINRTQALKDFSASITQFYGDDYFFDKWRLDGEYVLEFYADGTTNPIVRAWTKISSDEPSAAVDALVEESIDFEGTTDADARAVSFGPF